MYYYTFRGRLRKGRLREACMAMGALKRFRCRLERIGRKKCGEEQKRSCGGSGGGAAAAAVVCCSLTRPRALATHRARSLRQQFRNNISC